jgi:hypothetical protein
MNYFTMYIYLIFAIKIGFILTAISHQYLKAKGKEHTDLDKTLLYWKDRFEFIFVFFMSLLLIYIFNPRTTNYNNLITSEVKILLYLFGFILLITAKWGVFFTESKLFKDIKDVIG